MNATFADRLCYIMEKRGISAKDLAQRTNTPLAVISQYKSGKYKPKQNRLYDFATVLDVSIPWLMGLDVPMQPEKEKAPSEEGARYADLVKMLDTLPDEALDKVVDYVTMLVQRYS